MRFWKGEEITHLEPNYVFVFGSNPEGRHGKGAAKAALKFGAKYGVGRGLVGQTYAIPTKNLKRGFIEHCKDGRSIVYEATGERSLSREQIEENIREFYECAKEHPGLMFFVVYKAEGKNLNGYTSKEMFEMFMCEEVPSNVYFHNSFRVFIKTSQSLESVDTPSRSLYNELLKGCDALKEN